MSTCFQGISWIAGACVAVYGLSTEVITSTIINITFTSSYIIKKFHDVVCINLMKSEHNMSIFKAYKKYYLTHGIMNYIYFLKIKALLLPRFFKFCFANYHKNYYSLTLADYCYILLMGAHVNCVVVTVKHTCLQSTTE